MLDKDLEEDETTYWFECERCGEMNIPSSEIYKSEKDEDAMFCSEECAEQYDEEHEEMTDKNESIDPHEVNRMLRINADHLIKEINEAKEVKYDILRFFNYAHLPAHLQELSKPFFNLAHFIDSDKRYNDGAEKSVALRKLLESKDAAVRAALPKGDGE